MDFGSPMTKFALIVLPKLLYNFFGQSAQLAKSFGICLKKMYCASVVCAVNKQFRLSDLYQVWNHNYNFATFSTCNMAMSVVDFQIWGYKIR